MSDVENAPTPPKPLANVHDIPNTPRLGMPKVGQIIPVYLAPQRETEILRAEVIDVINPDHIIVCLSVMAPMMTKSHAYKLNDRVECVRVVGRMGDRWEAL